MECYQGEMLPKWNMLPRWNVTKVKCYQSGICYQNGMLPRLNMLEKWNVTKMNCYQSSQYEVYMSCSECMSVRECVCNGVVRV